MCQFTAIKPKKESGGVGRMEQQVPSKKMYGLAIGIFLVGTILLFFFFINSGVFKQGERLIVPGESQFTLDSKGKYTIFNEYQSVFDGKVYSNEQSIPGLHVALTDPSGQTVELEPININSTYTLNGREGVGVLTFSVDEVGTYTMAGWYDNDTQATEVVVLIKKTFLSEVFIGIGIFIGGFIFALIVFLWTFIKRRKATKTIPSAQG